MSTSQVLVSSTANFIEAAQRHPDTQQRLAAAEKALAAADKLQLTQAQLDWCSTELGHGLTAAVSAQESVAEVLAAYPTCLPSPALMALSILRKTTLQAVLADQWAAEQGRYQRCGKLLPPSFPCRGRSALRATASDVGAGYRQALPDPARHHAQR